MNTNQMSSESKAPAIIIHRCPLSAWRPFLNVSLPATKIFKEVKQFVKRCIRFTARPNCQQMGALPAARVVPSKPFSHTALDKSRAHRTSWGPNNGCLYCYIRKVYCTPRTVHGQSDKFCGFISCVFALSPYFNGLAESAIRSIKHHIRRVIGDQTLTYEELLTVLVKVEACLNSRPLHTLSIDPADFDVLTPGHFYFLVGEPTVTISECSALDRQSSTFFRWRLTQQLVQRIWPHCSADYLHTLQQRRKWQLKVPNWAVGDLVHLLEENQPPTK